MIFAFLEDGTLAVHANLSDVQREYEGVDVEAGAVHFYDESGTPLEARFTTPNRRGKWLGLFGWSSSGVYMLVPAPLAAQDPFALALQEAQSLAPNPWYPSLEALRSALGAGFDTLVASIAERVPAELRGAFDDAVRGLATRPTTGPALLDAIDEAHAGLGVAIGRGDLGMEEEYEALGRLVAWLYDDLGRPQDTRYAVGRRAAARAEGHT